MKIKLISILVRYCHVTMTRNLGLLENAAFETAFEIGRINRLDCRYKRTAIKTVLFCLSITPVKYRSCTSDSILNLPSYASRVVVAYIKIIRCIWKYGFPLLCNQFMLFVKIKFLYVRGRQFILFLSCHIYTFFEFLVLFFLLSIPTSMLMTRSFWVDLCLCHQYFTCWEISKKCYIAIFSLKPKC